MSKTLSQKTVRPGSLNNYSFYYSARSNQEPPKTSPLISLKKVVFIFLLFGAIFFGFQQSKSEPQIVASNNPQASIQNSAPKSSAGAVVAPKKVNECATNTELKFIIISVSQRKLWACEGATEVHTSFVITGMEKHASTKTPVGTYTVYAKQRDTVLKGADEAGSWSRPVAYWMPFLDNEHGTYGFHDANWRDVKEFGNVDPFTSDDASHGCVELPDDTQKWIYDWAEVGTNLTVKA